MSISESLAEIEKRISTACARSGRARAEVRLLAVSKVQPLEKIKEAYALGIRDFGENYVQELISKRRELMSLSDIRWHLIGPLQTNKAKVALTVADYFHALDSRKLLQEIAKRGDHTKPWPAFIEVNIDQEVGKHGIAPHDLGDFAREVLACPQVQLEGLMCIPEVGPPEEMRPAFKKLAELKSELEKALDKKLSLSMGMSEDFEVAIEEGATWIRVGRKLFGERQKA